MSIEAMKQAMEALCLTYKTVPTKHLDLGMLDEAITSLRTAIEQAEKSNIKQVIHLYDEPPAAPVQEPVAWVDVHDYTNLYYRKPAQVDVVPLYYGPATPPAAQPAPVQEPVAWMLPRDGNDCAVFREPQDFTPPYSTAGWTPLYTTPLAAPVQDECVVCGDKVRVVPRPWVGLTKEERDNFVMDCGSYQTVADIEAKLREKNTGETK